MLINSYCFARLFITIHAHSKTDCHDELTPTIPFSVVYAAMQLYHHPYSLDSQKVRTALEEKGIDYTSYHVNPLTGKNMNVDFFRMNPSAKLPVFKNGAHVIFRAIDIIQYVLP
jgi:hypothetical protein